jgi:dipeptidyl aminopeptidase/acylaminoacyl peptidase
MFKISCVNAWLLSCVLCAATAAAREYSIDQFMGSVEHRGLTFSPEGGTLVTSGDDNGLFNLKSLSLAGGEARALTQSAAQSLLIESYFPHDDRLLYRMDDGGDELDHLYVRTADGKTTDLTPGKGHKAVFLSWARDGRRFFVLSNERDPRYFDLYAYASDGYRRERIYDNDDGYAVEAVSDDAQLVAISKQVDNRRKDLYLWKRKERALIQLSAPDVVASETAQAFTADGKQLLITSDAGHEFRYLLAIDLAQGARRVLYKPDWDVWSARYTGNGRFLLLQVDEDARFAIVLLDAGDYSRIELPGLPDGSNHDAVVTRDARTLAFINTDGNAPADIYSYDLNKRSAQRLLGSLNPQIAADDLVPGEIVRFTSYDGVRVPGIVYRPRSAQPDNKLPALVWVHGGPGEESMRVYDGRLQYIINHGYVVYAINTRGSSGSGKTFHHLDDHRHGRDDLQDIIASKQMLAGLGYVDAERIGIMGWSYGGFVTLAALAFTPEEFAVGIDIYGVADWVRTLSSIPPWWQAMREYFITEIGDPRDAAGLRAISPLFHADKIQRPLMVLQGTRDPRVHKVESDEIVAKVRARGVPVDYVVFEDEGHGFRKKKNQRTANLRIVEFLDRHLKNAVR